MAYNLIITERADELIDRLTAYLFNNLKNPDAAARFLDELDAVYNRLEENPYQFAESKIPGKQRDGSLHGLSCLITALRSITKHGLQKQSAH